MPATQVNFFAAARSAFVNMLVSIRNAKGEVVRSASATHLRWSGDLDACLSPRLEYLRFALSACPGLRLRSLPSIAYRPPFFAAQPHRRRQASPGPQFACSPEVRTDHEEFVSGGLLARGASQLERGAGVSVVNVDATAAIPPGPP